MPRFRDLDDFTRGYIECAIWADGEEAGAFSPDDLEDETIAALAADASDFQTANAELLQQATQLTEWGVDPENMLGYLGHDFWLTRNGHGTGFWDRGLGEIGDKLTAQAHAYGSATLYEGNDGRVYVTRG